MDGPERLVGDRYVVEGLLARGGMADVYRARDRVSDRPVALKVLRVGAADPRRFETETKLLRQLEHPNLVKLLDAGQRGGVPYLVFELVHGPTLEARLGRGPLASEGARRVGHDVAQALAYVHSTGVVHRDVKPANILLAPEGRAVLTDFGTARLLADSTRVTGTGLTVGTAAYLAPEQLGGHEITGAADVYALGLVLVEALSGRPAFTGTHQEILAARKTASPVIPDDLEPPWPDLLEAMTAAEPGTRPDAATVAAHLRPAYLDEPTASAAALTADTAELDPTDGSVPTRVYAARRSGEPVPADGFDATDLRPVLSVLAILVVLAVFGFFAVSSGGSDDPPIDRADEAATSTTATSSTTTTTTTTVATTTIPPTAVPPPGQALATTCAALDARKQALDTQKQQVDETYRDDRDTREALKDALDAQKQDIDTQKQSLGC